MARGVQNGREKSRQTWLPSQITSEKMIAAENNKEQESALGNKFFTLTRGDNSPWHQSQ